MDVQAYMKERVPLVDGAIEARLLGLEPLPPALSGAIRHLLFPGGKRLRPIFSLATAEAVGARAADALPIALAVEFVHTYSLIHDDLPCMDDDDLRRGRPTVHKAFDESTAVLAGDALLTEAFGVLADFEPSATGGEGARLAVSARLAAAAGARGLVGGQVDDLAFEAAAASPQAADRAEVLASIHARKTAALFSAAITGGALLGGGSGTQIECLEGFARDVGIGFQIADDVLDGESGEAASILRLQGVEDARRGAEGLLDRALEAIEGWGERAEPLRALARFAIRRHQ